MSTSKPNVNFFQSWQFDLFVLDPWRHLIGLAPPYFCLTVKWAKVSWLDQNLGVRVRLEQSGSGSCNPLRVVADWCWKERFIHGVLCRRQESPSCFSKADLFIVRSLKRLCCCSKLAVWPCLLWNNRPAPCLPRAEHFGDQRSTPVRRQDRQSDVSPSPPCQAGPHPKAAQSVHCRFMRCHL